jgi:hypothetical protein
MEDLCNEYMDYSKPLWEFYLQEDYSETESLFIIRIHHAFADAGGFVGMMSMINDDQFKWKSDKKFPQPNILHHIFFSFVGPIYSLYLCTKWELFRKSDENAKKCRELNGPVTYMNKFYAAKSRIPFDKVRNCYKGFKEKTTFNDYLMGAISVGLHKWFKFYNIEGARNLKCSLPINTRPLPTCIEEVDLSNKNIGINFEFPICEKLENGIKEAKEKFHSDLNVFTFYSLAKFCKVVGYMPEALIRRLNDSLTKSIGFIYSNVPLSSEPWYICNKKASKIGAFPHTENQFRMFIVCTTYCGEIRLTAVGHENLKMDIQPLLDNINGVLLEEIEKYSKSGFKSGHQDKF